MVSSVPQITSRPCLVLPWLLLLAGLAGCASVEDKSDYYRHSMSDFREDWRRPGILLFETTSSSQFPADTEAGEAARIEWLAAWMKRTGSCPTGWEMLSRTPIHPSEVHVRRRDLRYELRCVEAAKAPAH